MCKSLIPCPFCGETPEVCKPEDNYGTFYGFECECGVAGVEVQISDLMSREERASDSFDDHRYRQEFIIRAMEHCIKIWNTRVPIATQ